MICIQRDLTSAAVSKKKTKQLKFTHHVLQEDVMEASQPFALQIVLTDSSLSWSVCMRRWGSRRFEVCLIYPS